MHEQLWFTAILNKLLGGVTTALLEALHIHPLDPSAPIPNYVAMQVLVVLLLVMFFAFVRTRLSVESPGAWQHIVESLRNFLQDQSREIIGHHSEGFTPFLLTLFLFILVSNLLGLVPTLETPTANPSVPFGCALLTFGYYNLHGILRLGVLRYLLQFAGPIWWLSPLMLPIEIISHLARLLSLTVRLWANMFAGELVTLVFFSMIPIGVPVIFNGLHILVAVLQAYVFVLLTAIYLSGAVATEH
jgi:F-type H+-transporting ATPase subunit a